MNTDLDEKTKRLETLTSDHFRLRGELSAAERAVVNATASLDDAIATREAIQRAPPIKRCAYSALQQRKSLLAGKVQRVGGWDMAANKPRPVKSLVPAGSVFFCSVENSNDVQAAINALHNQRIGDFTEYGYGHLAVGVWDDNATQGK